MELTVGAQPNARVKLPPRVADALLAFTVAGATVIALILAEPIFLQEGSLADSSMMTPMVALAGLQGLTLVLWRTRPGVGLILTVLLQVGLMMISPESPVRGLPVLLLTYSVGMRLPSQRALGLVVSGIVVEVVVGMLATAASDGEVVAVGVNQVLSATTAYLLPMALGMTVTARLDNAQLLRERAAREQQTQIDAAVASERRRIARELHDVAAHHLSGMVVQASAVHRLVVRDPQRAKEGAEHLRHQGKEALEGLRSVVGLLREDDGVAPVPGLTDLPELVDSTRALGVEVELHGEEELPALAPVVGAAVYRVVQQSLSNALQHAPQAPVTIKVSTHLGELTVEVMNAVTGYTARPSRAGRGGAGLAVMRERASLIGADLIIGPVGDGRWRVRLVLPLARGEGAR